MAQVIGIFALAFISFSTSIPAGLALGVNPVVVAVTAALSYVSGVVIVLIVGEQLRERLLRRFAPKVTQNPESRIRRIFDRFGIVGLGLLAPMTIGAQIGTVVGLWLGAAPRRLLVWMTLGAALWSLLITGGITIGVGALRPIAAQGPTPTVQATLMIPVPPRVNPNPTIWARGFCTDGQICGVGDFNGDGTDDILAFTPIDPDAGNIYVALSDGNAFQAASVWATGFCDDKPTCITGDFNGDGLTDVAMFNREMPGDAANDVFIALSNGSKFTADPSPWSGEFCLGIEVCVAADLNGDRLDDLVGFDRNTGDVFAALSTGRAFTERRRIFTGDFCTRNDACMASDTNGDGRADLISFHDGDVRVALSAVADILPPQTVRTGFCYNAQDVCLAGDISGDGKSDAIALRRGAGYAAGPFGGGAALGRLVANFCVATDTCLIGNFDGLLGDDLIAFAGDRMVGGTPGNVYVLLSIGAFGLRPGR